MKFWEDFSRWLEDASKVLSKEAGDLTLKGKLKLEIFDITRKLNEKFAELGRNIYEIVYLKKNEEWRKDRRVSSVIQKIRSLQRQLKKKYADYKKIGKPR